VVALNPALPRIDGVIALEPSGRLMLTTLMTGEVPPLHMARSSLPSPLRSPAMTMMG
jgi:hypothetical protein